MKRIALIIGGLLSLYLAWITGTGEILNYINFADPLNEMGFFGCCVFMASGCFIAGLSKA